VADDFSIPSGGDWDFAPLRGYRRKDDHFDCDRKPVPDMTRNEEGALQRNDAAARERAAIACQRHLRDLIKWHGKGHL
jgi:hypothetical protein